MGPMRRHGVMYWMDSMQELNSRRRSGVFTDNFVSILGLNMVLSSLTLEIFLCDVRCLKLLCLKDFITYIRNRMWNI